MDLSQTRVSVEDCQTLAGNLKNLKKLRISPVESSAGKEDRDYLPWIVQAHPGLRVHYGAKVLPSLSELETSPRLLDAYLREIEKGLSPQAQELLQAWNPRWKSKLKELPQSLQFPSALVKGEGSALETSILEILPLFPKLETLCLDGKLISRGFLRRALLKLPRLKHLEISGLRFLNAAESRHQENRSDKDLERSLSLGELFPMGTRLRSLKLPGARLSAGDLDSLGRLGTSLEEFSLHGGSLRKGDLVYPLSLAHLTCLKGFRSLKKLDLQGLPALGGCLTGLESH